MYVVIIIIAYIIPNSFFFFQKITPRTTSRRTTNTDITDIIKPAMVKVSEVSGVFAWALEDVVVLDL